MNNLATRISNSFCVQLPVQLSTGGMLVKVYPANPLEQPVAINQAGGVLGRDESCEICVSVDSISRRHAEFSFDGQNFVIRDLSSTNGTYVNDARIDWTALHSGDRLRFGNQIYKFITTDGVESKYHEIIFQMMTTDGLTQVYNKRFLLDSLEREMQQAVRGQQPLSLLMLDLDKFKAINDTHGHLAGDRVLAEFANRALGTLRSGEVLARFGGEEFAVLCAPAALDQALIAAERIRHVTAAAPIRYEQIDIPITVSIGIACFDPTNDPLDSTGLMAKADTKLYSAKQNGRNRIEI